MIDWLNDNTGAVQALAVCALVVITGVYAYFTKRMANEVREQTLAQDRPDLLLDVAPVGRWHEPGPDEEPPPANPWQHTYPAAFDCRVHNAGRHAAKEVTITIIHPGVLFKGQRKGFLVPGDTWGEVVEASPALQYLAEREPQGLREWLAQNGKASHRPIRTVWNTGAVACYRDIHNRVWAMYLVLGLAEITDAQGRVENREVLKGEQCLIELKEE